MNVTSLLNTSGGAQAPGGRLPSHPAGVGGYQTEERMVPMNMSSESRQHSRSRTPWDAGGYSLPLTLNIKNTQHSLASRSGFYSELPPVDSTDSTSPKSPNHRLSDSHSSLSSYTTMSSNISNRSRSHSRISSLSTVSEYQALGTFVSDTTPRERMMSDMDSGMSCPTVVEDQSPSPSSRRSNESVYFNRHSSRQPDKLQSPSDDILARDRGATGSASPIDSIIIDYFLPADSSSTSTSTSTSRAHQRTVSAPNFHSLIQATSSSRRYCAFRLMAEPSPPKSPQGDDEHQSVISDSNSPSASVEQAQDSGNSPHSGPTQPVHVCMYIDDCETGSQLRKIISHLFGRNKLCTKAIPDHIWVHWCRKHYQRCRYRDSYAYALMQIEMVVKQIKKVQDWSDDNVKANRRGDGVLKHWTLQARKREAKRLQSASRKRQWDVNKDDDDEEQSTVTAIPDWLQHKLNQQYNTDQMLKIAKDIEARMKVEEITQIPDIEILPEIITDTNKARTSKSKGRQAGSAHGHSKSEINTSSGSFSQDPKRTRTGASPFGMHNMQRALPYQSNNAFTSNAQTQASTNAWSPTLFGNSIDNNIILPTPVTQRQFSSNTNGDQQLIFSHGQPNANGGQQLFQTQGRSHARSMSENPVTHGFSYDYRNQASQQGQSYQQQQGTFPNYNFNTTGYGQGSQRLAANQGYGNNTSGNGYAGNAGDLSANIFAFGSTGLTPSTSTPSLQQTPVQQQSASLAGGLRSSNSMPTARNTNTTRRHVPTYAEYRRDNPLVFHHNQPNHDPHQNLGRQPATQEGNMTPVESPQQCGTQRGGGYDYSHQPGTQPGGGYDYSQQPGSRY